MAETQPGSALAGCVGLASLLLVGGCLFGGSGKDAGATTDATTNAAPIVIASNDTTEVHNSSPADDPDIKKAKATVKEQFFPDQVDHSRSEKFQKEWYMIKGIVQQSGYPCAAVSFVQQQLDGTFKALCKVSMNQNKYNAFLINPDTQSVESL